MTTQDEWISIRLSTETLERLKAVTEHKAGQRSRALRVVIAAGLEAKNLDALQKRVEVLSSLADEIHAIRSNLSRIGGNLNQLARLFNSEKLDGKDLGNLAAAHKELRSEFEILIKTIVEAQHDFARF